MLMFSIIHGIRCYRFMSAGSVSYAIGYTGSLTDAAAACALIVNDDETLCNLARWFMKEYQFMTDGYRLFSALNRLCDSENSWYNCGPSQKYILRQLKAVDFSLLGENRRKNQPQERASYSTRDSDGQKICAKDMDVALLMLYGHILHAGRSYAYAVSKSEQHAAATSVEVEMLTAL